MRIYSDIVHVHRRAHMRRMHTNNNLISFSNAISAVSLSKLYTQSGENDLQYPY